MMLQMLLSKVLVFAGFLAYACADELQNVTKASGFFKSDICYFPLPGIGPDNYPLNKTVGCNQCKAAIPNGVSIILQHCCTCCFYDINPRNGSVFLSNSGDNKPTFKLIHSCDKNPKMTMMSGNVTLDGETVKRVEKSGTCSTTYMPKGQLDEKYNGSSIKYEFLTENCKDSEEIIFIFNPTKSNGISVESAVGIAFGILAGVVVALSIVLFIRYKRRRSRTPTVTNGHPGPDAERGMNPNGDKTIELHNLQNRNGAGGQNGHLLDQSKSEKTANGIEAIGQRKDNGEEGSQLLNGRGGVQTDESSA